MQLDLSKIEDTPHLLDLLLGVEDILDSLDLYVFKNWIEGEVVSGPFVKKHWVTVGLKYTYKQMPDPRAAMRLLKHGVYVKYNKVPVEKIGEEHKNEEEFVWIIDLDVPRKLLNGMNNSGIDFYDDEVDADDISSAKDMGVDQDSGYQQGESGDETPMDGDGGGDEDMGDLEL